MAMEQEKALEQIEVSIEQAKEIVEDRDALLRLMDNKDFKRILQEKYMKEEAVRLVLLKGASLTPEQQVQVDKMINGIAALDGFLRTIMIEGEQMEESIEADNLTREEILKED
jgi:hypothetical protein